MPFLDSLRRLFQRPPEIRLPRRWARILMTDSTTLKMSGGHQETVTLANLSAGGARVQSPIPLVVHDRVSIVLPLGAGARCTLNAKVVYCQRDLQGLHYVGGLSFLGATGDGIAEVAGFIEDEQRRRSGTHEIWRG